MTEQQAAEGQGSEEQVQGTASSEAEGQGSSDGTQVTEQDSKETVPVSELRAREAENKKYRDRIRELEAAEQKRADAEKSDIEKAQAEVAKRDERIASLEGRLKRSSFIEQFGERGRLAWATARDLELEIEFEDEKATNVDAIRKELKKQEPSIFGDGQADAGSRTQGNGGYQGSPGVGRIEHAYANKRT